MKIRSFLLLGLGACLAISGCKSNNSGERLDSMRQVSKACLDYAKANNHDMPEQLGQLKPNYLPPTLDVSRYRMLTQGLQTCSRPDNVVFICEKNPDGSGARAAAFLSGRVMMLEDYGALLNAKYLSLAFQQYIGDHSQTMPISIYELRPYLDERFPLSRYELLTTGNMLQFPSPGETYLFREKEPGEAGWRCVGYVDGHVEIFHDR